MLVLVLTVFALVLIVAIVAGVVAGFMLLPLLPAIVVVVIGIPLMTWFVVVLYGLWRRAQPLRPFDAEEHEQDAVLWGGNGRHVKTPDGRIVEYLVYGSDRPDAKVIVQVHGAGTSAAWQCFMNAALCEELNLKGIAPSMPGYGYSDIHVGRRIVDFARDVELILDAERVNTFMVEGASLGTAHAMAIAWHFGSDRCVAFGINGPYLPAAICEEFEFRNDAERLPKAGAQNWYQAWNFFVAELMYIAPLVSPPARFMHLLPEGKQVKSERPWVFETIGKDQRRLVARGTQGQGWDQFSYEMNTMWGFDPREIGTKNVAVWYARDDSQCPPEHGEWLADCFSSIAGVNTDIRSEELGFGHFTYMPTNGPAFKASERSLPKTLLDLSG